MAPRRTCATISICGEASCGCEDHGNECSDGGSGTYRPVLGDGVRTCWLEREGLRQGAGAAPSRAHACRGGSRRAADVRTRRRRGGGHRAHHVVRAARGRASRRRVGAGKPARGARGQARNIRAPRCGNAARGDPGELDLGDTRFALYRNTARTRALPGRASGESAAPGPGGRALRPIALIIACARSCRKPCAWSARVM
jgi:hypothetical protein